MGRYLQKCVFFLLRILALFWSSHQLLSSIQKLGNKKKEDDCLAFSSSLKRETPSKKNGPRLSMTTIMIESRRIGSHQH